MYSNVQKKRIKEIMTKLIKRAISITSQIDENSFFDNTESYGPSHSKPSRRALDSHANFNHVKTSRGKI